MKSFCMFTGEQVLKWLRWQTSERYWRILSGIQTWRFTEMMKVCCFEKHSTCNAGSFCSSPWTKSNVIWALRGHEVHFIACFWRSDYDASKYIFVKMIIFHCASLSVRHSRASSHLWFKEVKVSVCEEENIICMQFLNDCVGLHWYTDNWYLCWWLIATQIIPQKRRRYCAFLYLIEIWSAQ